jgi:hypothetical protein
MMTNMATSSFLGKISTCSDAFAGQVSGVEIKHAGYYAV